MQQRVRIGFRSLISRRRKLRKEQTPTELVLWKYLRAKRFKGIKFRRQHGIGPYIVDFCAPRLRIVIEVDGDIHALPQQREYDKVRQEELESLGYQVLRYSNSDVWMNLESVLDDILRHILKTSP